METFDYNREIVIHMCKTIGRLTETPNAVYLKNVIAEIQKLLEAPKVDATDMGTHKDWEQERIYK